MPDISVIPRVSVLVPVYNMERYLPQCLESLLVQTLGDIEIICIDDGSTDSSPAILERYAAEDDRIRIITKDNTGYGDSMNQGIEAACGIYIGICEPDDYVDSDMFETLASAAERHGDPDIVKAAYWREVDAGTEQERSVSCFYYNRIEPIRQPFTLEECPDLFFYHPSIWAAIYRRSFLNDAEIRFKPIPGAGWADNPFMARTLVAAKSIVYVDKPLYHYREFEDGSMSHLSDWHILIDRWCEMDEVLRAAGIDDPAVLECLYNRGCAYMEMLNADFDTSDPAIASAARAMAARMDYDAIYRSRRIDQPLKDAYQMHVPRRKRLAHRITRH